DRLSDRDDFELYGIDDDCNAAQEDAALSTAHVYQVTSGLHDIPARFRVTHHLVERMPSLLVVSTIGAGYDTVDVGACTEAGVIVVNQNGGANAEAVVEHSLAMLLALCKKLPQADRALRSGSVASKAPFVGINAYGRTLGVVGLGQV